MNGYMHEYVALRKGTRQAIDRVCSAVSYFMGKKVPRISLLKEIMEVVGEDEKLIKYIAKKVKNRSDLILQK